MHTKFSSQKPEENRSLGRPKYKWEYNINVKLKEIGCGLNSYGCEYD
jgi:hypothetical protein